MTHFIIYIFKNEKSNTYFTFCNLPLYTSLKYQLDAKLYGLEQQSVTYDLFRNQNDHRYQPNNHKFNDQELRRMGQSMMIVICIASLISLTIGAVLLYKCYQQRSAANKLKDQMKLKRFQYASTLGINLYELNNDPRLSFTYHI
jgi:hypothetical protein